MENIAVMDSEELMHLALRATERDEPEQAITYLKRLLDTVPNDANATYLLGALHAQIGMYDRAALEMAKAVELEPGLHAAHFQLGLLHISSARVQAAITAWKALDDLGPEHPYYLFKTGLLHLANDEFVDSISYLKQGLAANTINPALNKDMRKLLNAAETGLSQETHKSADSDEAASAQAGGQHVLLSSYHEDDDNDTTR